MKRILEDVMLGGARNIFIEIMPKLSLDREKMFFR